MLSNPCSLMDLTLNIERRRRVLGIESGKNAPTHYAATKRRAHHAAEIILMRIASGRLRPGEIGAKMRATGGLGRQSAADGLRKRSPIGTRRKSRVLKPGFCVDGVGVAIG